ncbi:sulfurtransferase [Chitinibacter sp. S2-10]|uniref:sulfurtransferase n=1 Tax=Chitinibacter sp. S2-10 TaxID=3373597 RepID=UPI0039778ABE
MKPLITVAELKSLLHTPELLLVDCRHDLTDVDAGRAAYLQSHLPGARFMHLDEDLSAPKNGRNGRHPLPNAATLALKLGALGISKNSHVVAYDASGGAFAARLWWLLRWLGADQVQVLDGGWQAWLASEGELVNGIPAITPVIFDATPDDARHVSVDDVLANLTTPQFQLVDARSPERFVGIGETLDPVGGHIPDAANRFFMHNLQDGHFKPAEVLREEWQVLLGDMVPNDVVHQCGSGVTACHNLLALEVAGLSGGRLYPGSWSEWCSDPGRPVAV